MRTLIKNKKARSLAEIELEKALRIQNYHLENAEISREAVKRQEELAREHEADIVYWRNIVRLENEAKN
jgi:hypothetical protein